MSLVHVYKVEEFHNTEKGCDCWCEPKVLDVGMDSSGNPARVFVHEETK